MAVILKSKKGVSLIEAMVCILILAIAAIGGLAFFSYGRTDINLAGHERVALELARQKIERLRTVNYDDINSEVENDLNLDNLTCTRTTAVTEISDTTGTYKEITVSVSWTEKRNINFTERLDTIIAPSQ